MKFNTPTLKVKKITIRIAKQLCIAKMVLPLENSLAVAQKVKHRIVI